MNEPNMTDEFLLNSLKQLSPLVPTEVKSRLLYECGVSATEMKYRKQAKRYFQVGMLAVLLAVVAGGYIGNRLTRSTGSDQLQPVAQSPPAVKDRSTEQQHPDDAGFEASPLVIEPPFSIRSFVDEL